MNSTAKKPFMEDSELAKFPQQNPNPVLRISTEGELLYYNPASESILNFFIHPNGELTELVRSYINTVITNRNDLKERVNIFHLIYELHFSLVESEGYVNVYGSDVTVTMMYENDLISEKFRAYKLSKIKSQFLANMSHEIRTPLNGIIGLISLLKETQLNEDQQEYLSIMSQSSDFLLTIINEVLEFSKIESGRMKIVNKSFNIYKTLEEICNVFANSIYEKHLEFPLFIDEGVPEFLELDEGRLRQVLVNLIGNAIKFTDKGEIGLYAKMRSEKLHFEVRDTGCGIPSEQLQVIFDDFTQSDSTDSRKHGGTGLGLSICKKIIKAMGGAISVRSEIGKGSQFLFELPFTAPKTVQDKERTEFQADFLICSPNITVRKSFENQLKKMNHSFEHTFCLRDLLQSLSLNNPKSRYVQIFIDGCFLKELDSEQIQRLSKKIEENKERVILVSSKKNKKKLLNNLKIEHIPIIYKPIPNLHSLINNNTNVLKLASSNSIPSALNEFSTSGSSPSLLDPILIVEDNLINQKVTQAILKQHGYNVDFALNGVEGLEKLDQNKYSLVLMDCQMPVLDGFNATRQFRKMELQEQRKRTPIIAMTASAFKETRDKCKQYEMDDFISKPVKGEDLIAIIHKNLNGNDST